jgi:hypothetical protein
VIPVSTPRARPCTNVHKNGVSRKGERAYSLLDLSGWADLNRRPLDPQSSALSKLRHSPQRHPNPSLIADLPWAYAAFA